MFGRGYLLRAGGFQLRFRAGYHSADYVFLCYTFLNQCYEGVTAVNQSVPLTQLMGFDIYNSANIFISNNIILIDCVCFCCQNIYMYSVLIFSCIHNISISIYVK